GREELHDEERQLRVAVDVQDLDDVRVGQLLADRRLVEQKSPLVGLAGLLGEKDLHREVPQTGDLHDLEDLRTLASLQQVLDPVIADLFSFHAGPSPWPAVTSTLRSECCRGTSPRAGRSGSRTSSPGFRPRRPGSGKST